MRNFAVLKTNISNLQTFEFINTYEDRVHRRFVNGEFTSTWNSSQYNELIKILISVFTEFKINCCKVLTLGKDPKDGAIPVVHLGGGFEKKYKKYSQKYDGLLKMLNMKF